MIMTAVVKRLVDSEFAGKPVRYLDMCAAPGGKSIAAIEALPEGSLAVANEYDGRRARVLVENLAKHGFASLMISNNDASAYSRLSEAFDIIGVDAPCSGEGMMRKEPEAVNQWSEGLVAQCASAQRQILDSAWRALTPGGVLIYSTCTFNRSENEANVEWMMKEYGAESIDLALDYAGIMPGVDTSAHCCRFMPGYVEGEGLFVSVLRKSGHSAVRVGSEVSRRHGKQKGVFAVYASEVLRNAEQYEVIETQSLSYALPAAHAAFMREASRHLHLLRCGLPLGIVKGKDIMPSAELIHSTELRGDAFARCELSESQALSYLRGESLTELTADLPKGMVLFTYDSKPLGFAKNIGRRANNLYPDAYRLRLDAGKSAGNVPFPKLKIR